MLFTTYSTEFFINFLNYHLISFPLLYLFVPQMKSKLRLLCQIVLLTLVIAVLLFLVYDYYHVDMKSTIPILMVVTEWSPQRETFFTRSLKSLTSNTENHISLHLIVDSRSVKGTSRVVRSLGWRKINFTIYSIEDIYEKYAPTIRSLQKFFSVNSIPYYQKGLFYLVPIVHNIIKEDKIILLDTDIVVLGDIRELYREFIYFDASQFWGVTYEQSPYYAKALSEFRQANRRTVFGGYPKNGGIPGINTGVLLVDIKKLVDDSFVQDNYLTEKYYNYLVKRFQVQGKLVLGDQDFLSLLIFEHPEVFRILDCGWNRQLCQYFRKEFNKVFDLYYECRSVTKIVHGNCNTTIPKNIGY